MHIRVDIAGQRFGRLTVVRLAESGKNSKWLCRCDCGADRVVYLNALRRGLSKSCGCLRDELASKRRKSHGHSAGNVTTRAFRVWAAMKRRCLNPNCPAFKDYGARGIRVCERWMNFSNFLQDMGEPPAGTQLDRINNDGDYEPDNCRWTDTRTNVLNRRVTVHVELDGEIVPAIIAAERLGVKYQSFLKRVQKGQSAAEAAEVLRAKGVVCSGSQMKKRRHAPQ